MSSLILPPGVRSVKRRRVAFRCLLCEEEFFEGEAAQFTGHVSSCVVEHEEAIQQSRPSVRERGGPFDPDSWDREYEEWLTGVVGARMRAERRLERKPNEC